MGFNIKNTKDIEEISDFVANSINIHLMKGEKVLWFVTGGSSIKIESKIADKIKKDYIGELVITLTDERFGNMNHLDSNLFQLKESGFNLPNAKLISFLSDKNFEDTTLEIREKIQIELNRAEYKIGIFGLGTDGHIAGILPHSEAVNREELVFSYDTLQYKRITITSKVISQLDEAILFAMGELKWPMLDKFKKDFEEEEYPSLLLKKVPLVTIFTDYK